MVSLVWSVRIATELDVLVSRQRSRQIAALCHFGDHDQIRIATVVSELARNIFNYADSGTVEFAIDSSSARQSLSITFTDTGPGIADVDLILSGGYKSQTGMGMGILGARRLMDKFDLATDSGQGTTIVVQKCLPRTAPTLTPRQIEGMAAQFGALPDAAALAEVRHHDAALAQALETLKVQQDELKAVNQAVIELNAALDLKAAQLQQADVRKDEFLAILAHELRNPLSAIAMAGSAMSHPAISRNRSLELGTLITRQVGHMDRLVEDLLDVSRVTRGMVAIERKPVDMRHVVRSVVEQLGPVIAAKRQLLKQSLPGEPCYVEGDLTRLIQVGSNLLSNAARYTPEGGRISIALNSGEGTVRLQVVDDGIGIDRLLLPRLFDLYVQAENSTSGKGGLGVGLSLVRSIVELHEGTVSASSEGSGLGSQFEVCLPQLKKLN